jgi:hypothetical protein
VSTEIRDRVKHVIQRILIIILSSAIGLTLLVYLVDYAVFRNRVATNREPYQQLTVNRYDAIPQKNGKTEFIFNPPALQTCVNSLFPRQGYDPCWYLQKHTDQRTNY